jgi:hypothetical protein
MSALMRIVLSLVAVATILFAIDASPCWAQNSPPDVSDTRTQYPPFLANSYFGISMAAVDTPFSARQLEPGFSSTEVKTTRAGLSVALLGHRFGRYFAAEAAYTRPIKWARFNDLNSTGEGRSVWMALGEFKVRARVPITNRVAIYGDAGVAVTSRHGAVTSDGRSIVRSAQYLASLVGGGGEYTINPRWSLQAGFTRTAANDALQQPRSLVVLGGVRYHLVPLDADRLREAARGGYVFPKRLVQLGYAPGGLGLGVNDFFSTTVPIFWGAEVAVDRGFTVRYEQNVFHSRKWVAFDLGASVARWNGATRVEHLTSASVYPILKLVLLRSSAADLQVSYSVAGPTVLSSDTLNGVVTGTNRFIFQDLMGMAIAAGQSRQFVIGLGIGHYSNGNLSPVNPGINIPLTISIGYAF